MFSRIWNKTRFLGNFKKKIRLIWFVSLNQGAILKQYKSSFFPKMVKKTEKCLLWVFLKQIYIDLFKNFCVLSRNLDPLVRSGSGFFNWDSSWCPKSKCEVFRSWTKNTKQSPGLKKMHRWMDQIFAMHTFFAMHPIWNLLCMVRRINAVYDKRNRAINQNQRQRPEASIVYRRHYWTLRLEATAARGCY